MSVPQEKRRKSKLEVIVKALAVVSHTNKILRNKKKFDPEFDWILGNDLRLTARAIHRHAWSSNNLRVTDKETYLARKKLQTQAIQDCNELLVLIEEAGPTYHLEASRVSYWGKITLEARELLRAWRAADAKRYKHYDDS